MPRTALARGKTPRASRTEKALRDRLCRLALDMEEPLHEAIDLVQALNLMGYGMMSTATTGEERALVTVAHTASQRLTKVKDTWRGMIETARPRKMAG